MKKYLLFTLLFLFEITSAQGNLQNANWLFGGSGGLNFNSNPPTFIPSAGLPDGCATVSDANGNLLFATDGHSVWRHKDGGFTLLSNSLQGYTTDIQNVIIVPKPNHPKSYYIVTAGYYTEIDLSSGDGELKNTNTPLKGFNGGPAALTATKHVNGTNYWIICYDGNGNLYDYSVSENGIGIDGNPNYHYPGQINSGNANNGQTFTKYIKTDPNGSKIVLIGYENEISTGYFNTATGEILFDNTSFAPFDYSNAIKSAAFSPDSNILCFSTDQGLYRSLWTNPIVPEKIDTMVADNSLKTLQLGIDGKIYGALINNSALLEIGNPNAYNSAITLKPLHQEYYGTIRLPQWVPFQNQDSSPPMLALMENCPGGYITPTFAQVSPICYGAITLALPTTSINGFTGTWSPTLSNTATGTYTFTPTAGQCATTTTMTVTVNPKTLPTFNQVAAICTGGALAALPTTSTNGISGTWAPALNNTTTTTYTFTPSAGQCALTTTMTITVNPHQDVTPTFTQVSPICYGSLTVALPTTSINGYTGSWSPEMNSLSTTTYTFTPSQCVNTTTMTITVKPVSAITNMTATVCSATTFTATPINRNNGTVLSGTTYTWVSPTVTGGLTGGAAGTGAANINGTLTNTTNTAQTAIYTVTPSTAGCPGSTFTVTVTVNPKPAVNSMTATTCSAAGFVTTPANGTNGVIPSGTTYTWTAPAVTGGMTGGAAGTAAANISGTLLNTTNTAQTATYTVTPVSGGCTGSTFTVTVTVNPIPVITDMTAISCSAVGFSAAPINGTNGTVPAGTTYTWTTPTVTGGMTGGTAGTAAATISGTLTNPTNIAQTATYTVTPSAAGCTGSSFMLTVTVNPTPLLSSSLTPGAICSATTFNYTATSAIAGATFSWTRATVAGISNSAGSGFSAAISETLTNTTSAPIVVTYVITTTANGCSNAQNVTVTVNPLPSTPGAITGTATQCPSLTSQSYSIAAVANATSYTWSVPTGWTVTAGAGTTGITVTTGTTSQNGNISVTANNSCGTSTAQALAVTIGPATPATPGAIAGTATQCPSVTSQAYSITAVANATSYTWTVPTGWTITAGAGTTSIIVTTGTTGQNGNISVTATNSCGTSPARTLAVTVSPATPATPGVITGTATQCPSLTSQSYSIAAVANATSYTWTVPTGWTVTAGAGTTGITVTTGTAGQNGNITVTATNSCGTSTARTLAVTVSPATPSTPGVITGTATQCPSLTSQSYSIAAVANATSYTWTVPTGWTVTAGAGTTGITVTTGTAGQNGNISVTATNSCGTSTVRTLAVTVSPATPATPGAITGTASQCPSLTSQSYSIMAVANATSYTWAVPTGWTITVGAGTTGITVTTGTGGQNGNITVTANNSCGTSTVRALAVTISPSLPASVSIGATATTICSGTNVTFTATPTNGGTTPSYQWKVNGINVGTNSITYNSTTLANGDLVTVVMTSNATPCLTSSPATSNALAMTVNPLPVLNSTLTPAAICSATAFSYTATSATTGATFSWTRAAVTGISNTAGSGATASIIETLTNTTSLPVMVTYLITPTANACSNVQNVTLTVNPTPVLPTVSITQPICSSPTGTISITVQNIGDTFSLDNGVTFQSSNSKSDLLPGTYNVKIKNASGCISNAKSTVVNEVPQITPSFDTIAPICSGASLTLPTTSDNGVTGTWSPDLNNEVTTIYTFTPDSGQCAITAAMTITVNPRLVPSFEPIAPITSGTSLILPTSSGSITGKWMPPFNNQATTTYTFTPDEEVCATTKTLTVEVIGYNYNPISQVPANYPDSTVATSENFQDTKGELSISDSGTAMYNLPIAIPPSIKNVAPTINLIYNSGVRGGIAGQGWRVNTISTIARMSTRRDIDGFVDGVDFDDNDKLALDGQRLLLKTGAYWADGSTYETEYKSNARIELKVENGHTYFIITNPDGTRAWYGSRGSGVYEDATSSTAWHIVRYEDVYGNNVTYNYINVIHKSKSQSYIDNITFGANHLVGIAPLNKIKFNYHDAKRVEKDYIAGEATYASKILDFIEVFADNVSFRKYQLTHEVDTEGYERVHQVQEVNGEEEPANPVVFTYDTTPSITDRIVKTYDSKLEFDKISLGGDFDGDGRLDFMYGSKFYNNLFEGNVTDDPITMPFNTDSYYKNVFAASTLTNNKLNQFQSAVHAVEDDNLTTFKVYNFNTTSNTFINTYEKAIPMNNTGDSQDFNTMYTCLGDCTNDPSVLNYTTNPEGQIVFPNMCNPNTIRNSKIDYYEGDYNGDGISEVFVVNKKQTVNFRHKTYYNSDGSYEGMECTIDYSTNSASCYWVDLDPNKPTTLGSDGFRQIYNVISEDPDGFKIYSQDFNGDGKTDLMIINKYSFLNNYKIYTFNQLDASPWIELEIIGQGTLDEFSNTKQMLFGDYNGDGKIDIMLPDTEGGNRTQDSTWHIYYGNPNPAGGTFFVKETHNNLVEYRPDTNSPLDAGQDFDSQAHLSTYYALDVNKDGKSDMVRVWRKRYAPDTIFDPTNIDTRWWVTAFTNNIGNTTSTSFWPLTYDSDIETEFGNVHLGSDARDFPTPLVANFRHAGANTDLLIVRGDDDKVEYYNFKKDFSSDNRLKTVAESSGNIVHTVDYQSMMAQDEGLGDPAADFYSSGNSVTYPNVEIIKNSSSYLVSKLTATVNGNSKYQDFRYRGYVANFNYGSIGFIRTSRSSWYLDSEDAKIWSTQHNDVALRGANTISWSSMNSETVFSTVPENLLSTKTNVFDTYTNPTTKVYNVLLKSQTTVDALAGIKSETNYEYDATVDSANYFGLQTKSISKQYKGTGLQGTTTTATSYENNPTGDGAAYYIGRPKTVNTTTSIYTGDKRTSGEVYTYTGFNLTHTEKTGHNTPYALVEDMTYDTVGNLLTKTISAPDAPIPVASRMIEDEYDSSKRFVVKKTDHQLFETLYEYNTLGQVKKSTNYLGVVNDYSYDDWGKLINSKTTGVSTTPLETTITYDKLDNGGYTATSHNTIGDNTKSISQYDVLGRVVKTTTKGFENNSLISKKVFYDGLGRKTVDFEPSFSGSNSTKGTTYEYDYLQRPIKVIASTGRIQTLTYEGLTTISNDDGKVTTATVDALGNKIQTTDPGGTVKLSYYANGQLKESNYDGHKVSISIDGWGNKTAMTDPNAGTYSYTYDAFGQMLTETTPKGTTTNEYDDYGKLEKKTLSGDGTDIITDYGYNALAQLETETSKKAIGTSIDNFTYSYDSYHRPETTIENNEGFTHSTTVAYDSYGSVVTETITTQEMITGMSTSVITKNSYNAYNGIMDKMTDGNNAVLWQLNTANEKMQSLTETLGNGVAITNVYSDNHYFVSQRHVKNSVDILYNTYDFNAVKGTLNNRQNVALGTNETFTYDNLDRLTHWTNPLTNTVDSNGYDNRGRITNNNKLGTVNYNTTGNGTSLYQKTSIDLTAEGKTYYENLPKQEVSYTMFKSPISINESDKGSTAFTYNSHLSRQTMNYGYQIPAPGEEAIYTKTKLYADDGTVEILKTPTTITIRTYIGGDAYSAPLYIDKTKTIATGLIVEKKYYLHRDYLGSIIAISDVNGVAVERRQFDAWGNLAKLQQNGVLIASTSEVGGLAGLMMLDRGYTSHEHLAEVGLIQMNGRLYDPVLRSFLMPDNFIQQPENTQNYNRYAYVLNNPLKYTDPSGEIIPFLVAVGIAVLVSGTSYLISTSNEGGVAFSWGGLLKSCAIGAVSGAVTFGIGTAAESYLFSNFFLKATFQAVAHGAFQGGLTQVTGGKFWSGFAAGALSSIASSAWQGGMSKSASGAYSYGTGMKGIGGAFANSTDGMILFGTVSGGLGAALTGGNFWQGAATGFIVSGLNHAMTHMIEEKQTLDAFAKEKYGEDYKSKYGVKSLKWGSQMKEGEVEGYKYNSKEQLIYGKDGAVGGITTPDRRVYISDYFKNTPDMFLEGTIGHEFIHSYQRMTFGSNYNSSYSEFSAYQYSIDFSLKNNFDSRMTQQYRNYQSSYTKGPKSYNYQNIPGF